MKYVKTRRTAHIMLKNISFGLPEAPHRRSKDQKAPKIGKIRKMGNISLYLLITPKI
jgi:hypothetical protein